MTDIPPTLTGGCRCGAVRYRVTGAPREYRYLGDSGHEVMRSFCADCGTPLFGASAGQGYVIVRAGSLDEPEAYRNRVSPWTDSAPSWHRPDPDAPRYARNAPG